ncbi:PRC-barrel domain-containing protein [Pseudosulfitobacter pseudonitzschiae]|uniref:PRC-barrel domain-containing protein n=1 Tax=Pseudosulfitobacter pseudonitzschiae TaxID=1402135 RepID=UPI0012FD311C|nr:PRC-barrel domain-containing protein [Pseudosulfitobacter pseudonitzschiae]
MQRSSDIIGYSLRAKDGAIGSITDILFDDRHFGLRWVVIDTGTWLPGRKVLLPPTALGTPDPATREYPVDLTLSEIEDAPGLETDQPVSRQLETDILRLLRMAPLLVRRIRLRNGRRSATRRLDSGSDRRSSTGKACTGTTEG